MAKYKVTGLYTISFDMEVEANSQEEAEEMAYGINIETEWNGNSVCADGTPFDIKAELIDNED